MKLLSGLCFLFLSVACFAQKNSAEKEWDDFIKDFEAKQKAAIGKPYPEFSIVGGDSIISNKSWKGKTVFINFWFEACSPCIAEFDGLNQLYNKVKDNKNIVFISFTFETTKKIEEIKAKYKIQYPAVSITEKESRRLNLNNGFPTNIIVDKEGKIKFLVTGGSTDKVKASEIIMKEIYPKIL